jgi:outer membrane murein-binding lipoprotein Lpp
MEPNLHQIDDYNNTESKNKKTTVAVVVGICLLIGTIMVASKHYFSTVDDELVTKQETGIPKY